MASAWRRLGAGGSSSRFARAREDPALFRDVYLEYRDPVLRYFARRLLDPEHAFDLMAETFAELYARREQFRGNSEIEGCAWMWSIARTQLAMWLRRGEVERRNLERVGIPVPSLGPAEYERIEELADLARLRPMLESAMDQLTERERHVLREHVICGRQYVELAAELDTTAVAVRMTASRALRKLGRTLQETGELSSEDERAL
jgi:RNA polymerase sigma-70 factor (ECF subfamily)